MKRIVSLLLVICLTALSLAACSEKNAADETAEKGSQIAAPSDPSAADPADDGEDSGKSDYFNGLEARDFDGWTLNLANDGLNPEYFSRFIVDELTGDEFNDGLFNRQIAVQDKYNVSIAETYSGSVNSIKNCVTAGSGDVGFGQVLAYNCMQLILQKYVLAFTDLPVIDMTRPYWDQGAQKDLTFFGKMYYGYCDIGFDLYEGLAVMFYNGYLLTDNGIADSPFDLYMEGKWTLDAMYGMMTSVARDLNGDGQMNVRNDLFGWSGREFEYLPSLYSSGLRLISYDEAAETYTMDITQEGVMAVGDKLNKIINDTNLSVIGRNDETRNLFKAGGCLFYSRLLGDFRLLRDKEDDYGIICYPSLEENTVQEVYVQNPFAIMVPSDCPDTERLGTLIEALAAYTYDNILDVYINRAVIGKGARDEESALLLRKVITLRAFDLCYAFDTFAPVEAYGLGVKNGNYASAQQRQEKVFNKTVAKVVSALRGE